MRCLAGNAGGGQPLAFVVLATGELGEARGGGEACSREGDLPPLAAEEVEPFGVLCATSDEDFHALVLGVASVK